MEETNAEGPSVGPAGLGLEGGEDPFTGSTAIAGDDEDGNEDSSDANKSPENSKGLNLILKISDEVSHGQLGEKKNVPRYE